MKAQPIRALFVQSHTEIGGAENALLQLTSRLNSDAITASVALLGFGSGPLGERLRQASVEVIDVPGTRFRNLVATAGTIVRLAGIIRRRSFHVVVANGGHPLLFARPAALLAGVPCVWWVHNVMPADPLADHLIGVAETLLGAQRLVANSRKSAEALRRHFPATTIDVIPPGIDTATFAMAQERRAEARRALALAGTDFVVGVFGRLQFNKGQHTVIQAAHSLLRQGVPVRILIVGDTQFGLDGGYADKLKGYVHELGMESCVRFLGQRDDVAELLAACDVAVQPAVVPESYGLTVVEAMAVGLPVLASRHGGPLEIIEDTLTGLFFAPGDAAALSAALLRLYRAPELRQRLGSAAQSKALREFGAEHTAAKFAKVLASVVGGQVNGLRNPISSHHASSFEMRLPIAEQETVSGALPEVMKKPVSAGGFGNATTTSPYAARKHEHDAS